MKTLFFLLAVLLVNVNCFSYSTNSTFSSKTFYNEPECVTVLNRNISRAEEGIKKLQALKNSDTPRSVFSRDMMRFNSTVSGLQNSLSSCKAENTEYNFSSIDLKVSKIEADYKALQEIEQTENEAIKQKKTWIDVNKYTTFLRSFPSSHPGKLDMNASFIFTRAEVEYYSSDQSDDGAIKSSLEKFIIILNSENTQKAFLSTIEDMRNQLDKETALSELNFLIRDIEHMVSVFSPNNTSLTEVIAEAKAMQKHLSN